MNFESLFSSQGLFLICASMLIFSSCMVISVRNPVFAALFLILAFFNSAILWLMLDAEFLAITLVLVYVGAVMVLFLFVVMMLDINYEAMKQKFSLYTFVGIILAFIVITEMVLAISSGLFNDQSIYHMQAHAADYSNTRELGLILYTEYVYAFELAAVILLVAIIAAITLTLRRRPGTKHQNPVQQVNTRREDCIRMVDVPVKQEKVS